MDVICQNGKPRALAECHSGIDRPGVTGYDSISAAHPTLPLPSYARVTNLRNHYSMIVRINDRGPFAAKRIMDVSRKTAEALDFRQRGTTPVEVEYIGAASLAGSNDEKLLATLRSDGPASLAGWAGRDRSMVATNAASAAEAQPVASPAGGEASAQNRAVRRNSRRINSLMPGA